MEQYKITSDYDNIDWGKLIKVLMAYAYVFIGDNTEMGKSKADLAYDYTMEAISRYLNDKSKFDKSKNPDLVSFLKYYYLRQIISNSKNSGRYKYENIPDEISDGSYISLDRFLKEYTIDEQIDVDSIVDIIEETIANDDELIPLFKGRYYTDSKRVELCKDLGITIQEYDNRMKRLRRIVKKITQKANNHE